MSTRQPQSKASSTELSPRPFAPSWALMPRAHTVEGLRRPIRGGSTGADAKEGDHPAATRPGLSPPSCCGPCRKSAERETPTTPGSPGHAVTRVWVAQGRMVICCARPGGRDGRRRRATMRRGFVDRSRGSTSVAGAGRQRLTAREIAGRKGGRKISMLSAYDYPMALLAERSGIELILVGDSLGLTALGYDSTVPVTVDDILHHCRAVVRGAPNTHVVGDLPFLSYHLSDAQALENAGRLLQQGGADSIKLEGGSAAMAARVRALVAAGIPVMGHLGLTLQSVGTQGTDTQGADVVSALRILAEAEAIASAGAYAIVIEAVPAELARVITARIDIPTIGIGAGPHCDGQIALVTDMLGIESKLALSFSKQFAQVGTEIERAFGTFIAEIDAGVFPGPELTTPIAPIVLRALEEV